MSGAGLPEPESDAPEPRQHEASGAWAGYLIFSLLLLFLIVLGVQAAYDHRWASVAGVIVFLLVLFLVPTGGLKRLRRLAHNRKAPTRSGTRKDSADLRSL
jgi:protein-S-isoprenylcysteine O-methyltransferase Ste14